MSNIAAMESEIVAQMRKVLGPDVPIREALSGAFAVIQKGLDSASRGGALSALAVALYQVEHGAPPAAAIRTLAESLEQDAHEFENTLEYVRTKAAYVGGEMEQ